MLSLTAKQKEYWRRANHRWNIKSGATRSGKTYLDYYLIPKRISAVRGRQGLIMMIGNTRGTLQRNVIEPMQRIWGAALVSDIRSDNTAYMFGEKVYCIGADKVNQVNRLRGSGISYCYGDEVVTWNAEVFNMLKSRLDKDYSVFDGTCNPEGPTHWFKKFIDSDADIFEQSYTLYDNEFLSGKIIKALETEYRGTVYFDRYVLGKWVRAEGAIYRRFADDPEAFYISAEELPELTDINIGVDFGGSKSNHAFSCSGIDADNALYALKSVSLPAEGTDTNMLIRELDTFTAECVKLYGRVDGIYCDSAEQTIINTIRRRMAEYSVYSARKHEINDRIRCMVILQGTGRFKIVEGRNDALVSGLRDAVWDSKSITDKRLDDGTSDIDILDANEYSWERFIYRLTN